MILLSASKVWLWFQSGGGIPASRNESWGGGRDPSDSPRKSTWLSPRLGCSRIKVGVLSSWSPPTNLIRPSATGKMNFPFLWEILLPLQWVFWVDFRCVHRFQLLNVCNQYVTLPNSHRVQSVSKEQSTEDFLSTLMDSLLVFRRNRVILNQWTKRNDWSFKRFSKTSLAWSLSIIREILNVSQIGKTFHRICPPIFIQTWLQQYCRRAFFHFAYCSLSSPICFRSVWCRRTMIPGKIFTSFAKFQGLVSVNDFRLPIRRQELLEAPSCFLRSFCLARIRLTPAYWWLFRDSQPSLRT